MKGHEIENLAHTIIDRAKAGQRVEDYLYELKADWPDDPGRAAHRIAGHGNSAHGEPFLWIIGVDEKKGVTGASPVDVAKWYQQVEKFFDGHAPEMKSINLSVDGQPVTALFFKSGRVPFVVKNPQGGYPDFIVPWREGTRLRAARRDELLRILTPLQREPDLDVVGATLQTGVHSETRREIWCIALKIFVMPKDAHRIVIPFHRCKGELRFPNQNFKHSFSKIVIRSYSRGSETITATETEIIINAPGTVLLNAEIAIPARGGKPGGDANVTFDLYLATMDQWVPIRETLPICMSDYSRWELGERVEAVGDFFFA